MAGLLDVFLRRNEISPRDRTVPVAAGAARAKAPDERVRIALLLEADHESVDQ